MMDDLGTGVTGSRRFSGKGSYACGVSLHYDCIGGALDGACYEDMLWNLSRPCSICVHWE